MDCIADVEAHPHQLEFINSSARHPALVAGFGAGKSHAGMLRGFKLKNFSGHKLGVYAPTYALLRDIWYEKFETYCNNYNLLFSLNKSEKVMYIQGFGQVIFRSMDDPASIIGYEVHDSIVDELDTMKKEKAELCWKRILARQRCKKPDGSANTTSVMTTPEGYNFVYDRWKKNPSESYHLIHASTYDNAMYLPEDYIPSLKESYDANLLEAYLNGHFVNLTTGRVYYAYEEEKHHISDKVEQMKFDPTLPICLCVDFNVNPMIWTIVQFRNKYDVRVIAEVCKANTNTWEMCVAIKSFFKTEWAQDKEVVIYGDAAGEHNDTRSTYTDYTIIDEQMRGFFGKVTYKVPRANPAVRTRVLCVNNVLSKGGVRLNASVKELGYDFLQMAYNSNGEPDKSDMKRSHASDGFGYLVAVEFPIVHKRNSVEVTVR